MGTLTVPLSSTASDLRPQPETEHENDDWAEALVSDPFRELMTLKIRSIGPLLGVSFTFIVTMTLLAGYGKEFMGQKVIGAFNVGYLMVLLTYLLCWAVSLIYVRAANRRFDAQAVVAIEALRSRRPG